LRLSIFDFDFRFADFDFRLRLSFLDFRFSGLLFFCYCCFSVFGFRFSIFEYLFSVFKLEFSNCVCFFYCRNIKKKHQDTSIKLGVDGETHALCARESGGRGDRGGGAAGALLRPPCSYGIVVNNNSIADCSSRNKINKRKYNQ
jgi:hypothetical protein